MNLTKEFLQNFVDGLSAMLGENCEIVIHDFANGLDHTVVKIINNLTDRAVGDAPTSLFFERVQEEGMKLKDFEPYYIEMKDGRTFKAFATFVRDEEGNAIGAVCVKIDITGLLRISDYAKSFVGKGYDNDEKNAFQRELYAHSLDELMDFYLEQVEREAGKSASMMSKAEKLRALDYLDQKGVLLMAKSNVRLCEFFGFSKFSLYNYLETIRSNRGSGAI